VGEAGLFPEGSAPDAVLEFLLGDEGSTGFGEDAEAFFGAAGEFEDGSAERDLACGRVPHDVSETQIRLAVRLVSNHCVSFMPLVSP
jgi:hypothetical protein